MTKSCSVNLQFRGLDLEVVYYYTPGRPGCHTLPNGDPGYPDEPPEVDIESVRLWRSEYDLFDALSVAFLRDLEDTLLELEADAESDRLPQED